MTSKFISIQIESGIVKRAARGDIRAHEVIYRSFSAPVYSLCLRLTQAPDQAEDLLQETFMEVLRNIGQFRGDCPIGGWIRQIALSKTLMLLRSSWRSRGQALEDGWEDAETVNCATDETIDLDTALAKLTPLNRTVIWLHDVEGFTHKEIAKLMGKKESFSKSHLMRAYRKLRPLLQDSSAQTCDAPAGLYQPDLAG